ncbi:ABC transporter F family member 4-like [Brachionus plicatilis]|uniref:ABC transporter F family member 4-like n=1 Tax=Brachionus plicatilis TaxID=10195 RepID=A0A3M7QKL1_BRAPC|nr:ABC transporter F family member 4-like [Brachionus plicatilis]
MVTSDLNLWNLKKVDPPPFVTLDYTKKEFDYLFQATTFSVLFKNHLEKLKILLDSGERYFLSEKQILEKIIFKNWNSLRKEKSFQFMKKLKSLLNNFVDLKFSNLIETINVMTRSVNEPEVKMSKISLPSKEVFEYFLLRLHTVLVLFDHAIFLIRDKIYFYIIKYIKNGIFLSNNLLYMSNTARIYCIIKKYHVQTKFLYNNLREHISLFKSTSIKWSESFNIEDLPTEIKEEHTNFNNHVLEKNATDFEKFVNLSVNSDDQDLGELIDRDSIEPLSKFKNRKPKKKPCSKNRKILFKKIILFVTSSDGINEIKSKFKRFIKIKLKKMGSSYSNFLKDCLADKKVLINELNGLFENSSNMKVNEKSLVRKSIIRIIRKLIK